MDSFFYSRIHFEFTTLIRIYYWFILLFSNSFWIHYLWCEFTMNSLIFLRIYYEFTIDYAKSLWIDYLYRQLTMDPLSFSHPWSFHYEFAIFFSISIKFIISNTNSLWIHYLFRGLTMNSLSNTRILFEFVIFFAESL